MTKQRKRYIGYGFVMIVLIVMIFIIGLTRTLVYSTYTKRRLRARVQDNLQQLHRAWEVYELERDSSDPSTSQTLEDNREDPQNGI